MLSPEEIQTYFREVARRMYRAEPLPPFTMFFHPDDPLVYLNYAIPDVPAGGDLQIPLEALKARFTERNRVPRFEYVEAFAPALARSLLANGFAEEMRAYLMEASPSTTRPTAAVKGLEIQAVDRDSPRDLRAGMQRVQRTAFGMPDDGDFPDHDPTLAADGTGFLALLDGSPAAAANLLPSVDGVAEIAGVATLPELRRRGIAGALTSRALRTAFDRGLSAVVLSAGSEEAGRVYAAAGFVHAGTTLSFSEASAG